MKKNLSILALLLITLPFISACSEAKPVEESTSAKVNISVDKEGKTKKIEKTKTSETSEINIKVEK